MKVLHWVSYILPCMIHECRFCRGCHCSWNRTRIWFSGGFCVLIIAGLSVYILSAKPPQCRGEHWYAAFLACLQQFLSFCFLPPYLTFSHSVSVFLSPPAPPPTDRHTIIYAHTSNVLLFKGILGRELLKKAWISHQISGVFLFAAMSWPMCCFLSLLSSHKYFQQSLIVLSLFLCLAVC